MESANRTQRSKTYFEQISVEIVKKIAKEIPANDTIENGSISVETRDEPTSAQCDWREVAQRVQKEQDPEKMIGLVQQLIETFDKEKLRGRIPATRESGSSTDT
jgi:hypothetical protein